MVGQIPEVHEVEPRCSISVRSFRAFDGKKMIRRIRRRVQKAWRFLYPPELV